MTAHGVEAKPGAAPRTTLATRTDLRSLRVPMAILVVLGLVSPFFIYPVFLKIGRAHV